LTDKDIAAVRHEGRPRVLRLYESSIPGLAGCSILGAPSRANPWPWLSDLRALGASRC
jgi:hypothetical protein